MFLYRSTLQLLRFHFSLFLLPVYLFAISQLPATNWSKAILAFIILHLLVYPSSNGYNSYMDRDETPIGGLQKPLQPTRQLFHASLVMDFLAIGLSLMISYVFVAGVVLYILASRAYSYRGIRLKKYPFVGFLVVFIFQGSAIFFITYSACADVTNLRVPFIPCLISSLLVGASYPLTQVYQHVQDKKDGVTTLSYVLGKRGTFVFSMALFLSATGLLFFYFSSKEAVNLFWIFLLCTFPVVLFFVRWMYLVWIDENRADFKNSLWMNIISTVCLTLFFSTLILIKYFE
ncbi:MAG: UbiA family prenyltransferase [Chitinophagaceae bacterium]